MTALTTAQSHDDRICSAAAELMPPLPPALIKVGKKLRQIEGRQRKNYLTDYYEIGTIARDALAEHFGDSYGNGVVSQLAEVAQINPRTLYDCLRLVKTYSPEEYAALVTRGEISWSHVVNLLAVDRKEDRERLVDQVVAEELTADELSRAIADPHRPKRAGSGRKPAPPKNLVQAFGRLQAATQTYQNVLRIALFGDQFDLPTKLGDEPPDALTHGTRAKVEMCAQSLRELAEQISANAARLEQSIALINERIAATEKQRLKATGVKP